MRSKIEALQCSCGCELSAHNKIEVVHNTLLSYYGNKVTFTSMVDCESGTNDKLLCSVVGRHPDTVHKEMLILAGTHKRLRVVHKPDNHWELCMQQPYGVFYEPAQPMGHNPNI